MFETTSLYSWPWTYLSRIRFLKLVNISGTGKKFMPTPPKVTRANIDLMRLCMSPYSRFKKTTSLILEPKVRTLIGLNIITKVHSIIMTRLMVLPKVSWLRAFENRGGTKGIPSYIPENWEKKFVKNGKIGANQWMCKSSRPGVAEWMVCIVLLDAELFYKVLLESIVIIDSIGENKYI